MNDNQEKDNSNWWTCSCGRRLGRVLNSGNLDKIEIQGRNGEIYEVGFNYIKIVCPECRKENYIRSDNSKIIESENNDMGITADGELVQVRPSSTLGEFAEEIDKPLERNFFELSQPERKILLKNISERQREEYRLILENIPKDGEITDERIGEISKKEGLPPWKIIENIYKIIDEIRIIKKDKTILEPTFEAPGVDDIKEG